MNTYFYAPPFADLFKSDLTPVEKLVYLQINSWFGYCEYKNQPCRLNAAVTASELNLNINEVFLIIDTLKERGFIKLITKGNQVTEISNNGTLEVIAPWMEN